MKESRYKRKIEEDEEIRINKFLSDAGYCSRREADRLIEQGRVFVGKQQAAMGQKVTLSDHIFVDGKPVTREEERIVLMLNKPVGIECTSDLSNPDNVIDYIGYPKRIYPIGRLDKQSQGLLLFTNDGSIVNHILKASNYHEKEYLVTVDKPVTEEFLNSMAEGVEILDQITRPCRVKKISRHEFNIVLTQGLNRQIRRMCEALGYHVQKLKRIRVMNVKLGNLAKGAWRMLTEQELKELLSDFEE